MTPFAAPDAETLRKFALGDLPQDEWDRVARHLEAHPPRSETIAELGTDDTFVSALRAVPPGAADDSPELRSIIAAAAKLVGADETGEHESGTGSLPFVAASEAEIVLPPNGRLGRFRIVRELGRGGMGAVFAAVDEQLGRDVALKVMLPRLAANPVARERFLREARTAALVEHDNIVPILEVGEDGGIPFIAMPLLRGESLDDRLKAGALPVAEAVRIARDMVEGLAAAHAHGLIHRDIKPSNVWLETNPDGRLRRVRILDFGLARRVSESDRVTLSGTILGTPAFMAPEQARAAADVDARADLFSLGGVLYRMTTGRNPFHGTDTYSLLSALATDTPKAPTELNADVPRAMNDLILKLLQKDPAARPQSAAAVLTALDAIPTATVTPAPRRSRALPIAAIALSLIGLVGILFGGTIVRIATNKGELVVEVVDDPNVEIVVKQDGAVVVDKTKDRRFVLTAKDGEIEFLDPETGATAQTKTFRLTRGGADRVVARMGDRGKGPVVEKPKSDERRATVERILAIGGNVVYFVGNRKMVLTRPDQMPAGPFDPVSVGLFKVEKVTAELIVKIGEFEKLEHLHVSRSSADSRGFERFDRLSALQVLDVAQTGFDDSSLRPIGKLPELHELHLSETRVTAAGLKIIEALPKLRKLGLSNLQVGDGGMAAVARISTLEILGVGGNGITEAGLMELASLPALADLTVSNNPKLNRAAVERFAARAPHCRIRWDGGVIEPTAIPDGGREAAKRKALEWIVATGGKLNCLDGNSRPFGVKKGDLIPVGAVRVAGVHINGQEGTGAKLVEALSALPSGVASLSIHYAPFGGNELEKIVALQVWDNLEHLSIPGWNLANDDLRHLQKLSRLKKLNLNLSYTSTIGNPGATHLRGLPLTHLGLASTSIDDGAADTIASLRDLRELSIADTQVTSTGLARLRDLPELVSLHLGGPSADAAALAELRRFPKLDELALTNPSDASLAKLAEIPGLLRVSIYWKAAPSDAALQAIAACPRLNSVALMGDRKDLESHAKRLAAMLPKIRIEWPDGAIDPKSTGDPDRRTAHWVLAKGGKVRVNGERIEIADAKDLPKEPFRLTACNLSYRDKLDETGMAVFASCRHLEELDFLATKVTAAGLGHFRHTSNLEVLVLDFTFIDDDALVPFQNCTKLRVLGLKTTKVTARGLAHLARNRNLTELSLEGPTIDDAAVAHFQNNHKLRNLFLSHAGISNDGLAGFANCTGLVSLNLDHVGISDSGFRKLNLKSIQEMILSGTGISDAGLAPLDGNTAIHTLHLAGTKVTDAGLAKLKNCSALATLNLGKLPVTDDGLAQLNGLKFTALNLGYTKISDDGLAHLKSSTRLIQLELPNTAISDKGVSALREFRNLKMLELSGCTAVTGTTFTDSEWNALESLGVARTGFSDDGLAALAKCPNLRMLHCEGSKATRAGAYKLHDALPKCRIVWDGGTIEPK